ncbi:hypothetical protein IPM62_00300 [Candidatus Woesebacteria bacterium]|nr:MAG: hypothetical protein IPM62_00300 [Candidatus Woesebacteria bacterium]
MKPKNDMQRTLVCGNFFYVVDIEIILHPRDKPRDFTKQGSDGTIFCQFL